MNVADVCVWDVEIIESFCLHSVPPSTRYIMLQIGTVIVSFKHKPRFVFIKRIDCTAYCSDNNFKKSADSRLFRKDERHIEKTVRPGKLRS